jgi:hypothetical protein
MNYSKEQLTKMFRRLASTGTAPEEGCELFGVGYDDAFRRLLKEYVEDALPAGESAEKFVIGPYGSGKTHFLRHFMTLASARGCVTSEIQLNKKIDYTQTLVVYREVASALRAPGCNTSGIKALLEAALHRVNAQFLQQCPDDAARLELLEGWICALDGRSYKFDRFGKIAQKALRACIQNDKHLFESLARWIQGEVDNRDLIKDLPRELYVTPVQKSRQELFASDLMLSLCQFIRYAGFKGTIIGMDEAEQGFDVDRQKQQKIMSMLQANINAVADLQEGSVLIIYAFIPDLEARFASFAALQQRIDVPADQDFFVNGNTLAAKIDLTRRDDAASELRAIGSSLTDLFFRHYGGEVTGSRTEAMRHIEDLAKHVLEQSFDSGNRRTMVKATCAYLWKLRKADEQEAAQERPPEQGEV